MTFERAAAFVMPLGRHKGMALGRIAEAEGGLDDLTWLLGRGRIKGGLRRAIEAYLAGRGAGTTGGANTR